VNASSTPRLRFKTLDELNAWLLDKCIAYAKCAPASGTGRTDGLEVFEAERPKLVPYAGRFRRIPRGAGIGLEDLSGAVRQQ